MNSKITSLIISALILLSGCSEEEKKDSKTLEELTPKVQKKVLKKAPIEEVVKKIYSVEEIYNTMCIGCHSSDGSGNTEKLTPSMTDFAQKEIFDALKDVEADKGHLIMEYNRGQILKMDMEYSAKEMSEYMYNRFNK